MTNVLPGNPRFIIDHSCIYTNCGGHNIGGWLDVCCILYLSDVFVILCELYDAQRALYFYTFSMTYKLMQPYVYSVMFAR